MSIARDLVIGGTGMLSSLCERLALEGRIAVVARNQGRLDRLASRVPGRVRPISVDYRASAALTAALEDRYRRCVCWVHEDVAPDAPLLAASQIDGPFWHVLGSASADPARPEILQGWRSRFGAHHPALDYRQVVLGFVPDGGNSRWLTDSEISDGVWDAMQTSAPFSVIGTVVPWSRRP